MTRHKSHQRRKRRNQLATLGILALGVVLAAIVVGWFYYPDGVRHVDPDRSMYPVRGIDLSAHNGTVDFRRVSEAGIDFAYLKASEGVTFRDSMFHTNYCGASTHGLRVGAYHFFRFDREGELQAQNFLEVLSQHPTDLPPAIDVEDHGNPANTDPATVKSRLRAMIDAMLLAGYTPIVYTNKRGYARYIEGSFDDIPLWICSFTDPPIEAPWILWQHSHEGTVDGIDGLVDLNTFNGQMMDFAAWPALDGR